MSLIWDDGLNYHYCLCTMYLCVRVHTNRSSFHVSAIKQSPPPYANKYHTTTNKWQLQSLSLQLKIITIYLQLQIKGQNKTNYTQFPINKNKNKTNYSRLNWTSALLILPVFFLFGCWNSWITKQIHSYWTRY